MRVLLDTHSFLWWVMDDVRLPLQARAVLRDGRNTLVVSAATGWEIAIKARLGKMMLPGDPAEFILQQIRHNQGLSNNNHIRCNRTWGDGVVPLPMERVTLDLDRRQCFIRYLVPSRIAARV
jgi:hypothetical protein